MSLEKAVALVVRGTDWSETSRIATLFTRSLGKVRALAKGGRRLRSNFDVALDLLTVCDIVFIKKAHGGLDLLTEARVKERFPALRADLPALYAGYYVAELLADGTQDYDPHPELFDAALGMLRGLCSTEGEKRRRGEEEKDTDFVSSSPPLLFSPSVADRVSAFELVWLKELGYSPRLEACAGCDRELTGSSAGVGFSPAAGGVLCPDCRVAMRDHRLLSAAAWSALRGLVTGVSVPLAARREVRQVLGQTVSYVLGRRPRLLGYVDGT